MNQLKQQFKQVIENKCLTKEEKIYMGKIFGDFINRRKFVVKNSFQLIDKNDFWQKHQLESIIGNYHSSHFSNFD